MGYLEIKGDSLDHEENVSSDIYLPWCGKGQPRIGNPSKNLCPALWSPFICPTERITVDKDKSRYP